MNLHQLLIEREAEGRPVRVGLIGAGRFGNMYLAQARNIPGIHVVAVADINVERARNAFRLAGWPEELITDSVDDALGNGTTAIIGSSDDLFRGDVDVVVEATGNPIVGISHALRAFATGQHVIMVTVEADALAAAH